MRKKKSLLSEAQVRRFQSLASIQPIHGMKSRQSLKEQDEFEMEDAEADLGSEEVPEEVEMGPEEVEMGPEELEAGDTNEADVELDEELVAKFAEAVATMQEVSDILSGGAPEEDLAGEEDEDLAPVEDEEGEEELEMDAGGEDLGGEEEIMEALKGVSYVPSQKEVVKVVAKRVARRLQEAKIAQRRLNRALGKK